MRLMPVVMIAGVLAVPGGVAVAEKRLRPSAHPSRPTQSERVVIRFRARETLDGVYRAVLPPSVDGHPEVRQWCVGVYRAKVFFKQTVRCRPSVQCGDSVEIPLGSTTFTVVAEP